jgi:hypothetical protein
MHKIKIYEQGTINIQADYLLSVTPVLLHLPTARLLLNPESVLGTFY